MIRGALLLVRITVHLTLTKHTRSKAVLAFVVDGSPLTPDRPPLDSLASATLVLTHVVLPVPLVDDAVSTVSVCCAAALPSGRVIDAGGVNALRG